MTDALHGYTMADLDSAARIAVYRRGTSWLYPEAWSAAAEALCAAVDPPHFRVLMYAATDGVNRAIQASLHALGRYDNPAATGGQFYRYWFGWPRLASPWEDAVVDRLALMQVWHLLSPLHQEALIALATYEQYDLAAEALGISYAAFGLRLKRARRAFRAYWHDWESPSKTWGRDERKRRGEKLATQSRYDSTRRPDRKARRLMRLGGPTDPPGGGS